MRKNTVFLDGVRGLAAVYVLVHHSRWLLWEGFQKGYYTHPENYNLLQKIQAFSFTFFNFGHESVLLFFILSGFVIHLSVCKSLEKIDQNFRFWGHFLYKRLKRLYPAFLFAILLTFLLDHLGGSILQYKNYINGSPYNDFTLTQENTSATTLLGNLLFLMKTYVPVYGSNGATWSLSFEWWFYIIYPFFYIIAKKKFLIATIFQVLLFVFALVYSNWPISLLKDIFSMMIIWWFGVILAEIYLEKIAIDFRYIGTLIIFLPLALFKYFENRYLNDLIWGIGLTGLISFLFSLKETNVVLLLLAKLKWLGECSYTIYIIHVPILFLFHSYLLSVNNNQLPQHFIFIYVFTIFLIFVSYILAKAIEKPFTNTKKIKLK